MTRPVAYARRILVNLALSGADRRSRRRHELAGEPVAERLADVDEPSGHDELLGALAALPPRQRTVLVLRYFLDLPEAEVAAAMKCSLGTVKSTSSRGLARDSSRRCERPMTRGAFRHDPATRIRSARGAQRARSPGARRRASPRLSPVLDYKPRVRRLRPPRSAIGAAAKCGGRCRRGGGGHLAEGAGASNAVRGVDGEADRAVARKQLTQPANVNCQSQSPVAGAAAEAQRHPRAIHVLDLRQRQCERDVHRGTVVHRGRRQPVERADRRARRAHLPVELRTRRIAVARRTRSRTGVPAIA